VWHIVVEPCKMVRLECTHNIEQYKSKKQCVSNTLQQYFHTRNLRIKLWGKVLRTNFFKAVFYAE